MGGKHQFAKSIPEAVVEHTSSGNGREMLAEGRDPRSLLLTGILSLLLLCALYLARDIAIPMMLAFLLNLLLQPIMRQLLRIGLPKPVAALLTLCVFVVVILAIVVSLAGSATAWIAKAPESLPRLEHYLSIFQTPLLGLEHANQEIDQLFGGVTGAATGVTLRGPGLSGLLFSGTVAIAVGFGVTMVLLFFLLIAGDLFLRRLVEIVPTLSNKKQVVDISREIETNISAYLVTITLVNVGVGAATGAATYFCGLPDPLLWGAIAFVLNYILILGPITNFIMLVLVGLLSFDGIWWALLPAAIYFIIHIAEGAALTPILMAHRFTLNPVLVVTSLIFWYWMWGIAGALLAIPMLAISKIVCDRIAPLMPLGHFLGGEARS